MNKDLQLTQTDILKLVAVLLIFGLTALFLLTGQKIAFWILGFALILMFIFIVMQKALK